jgi:hypothetical protein
MAALAAPGSAGGSVAMPVSIVLRSATPPAEPEAAREDKNRSLADMARLLLVLPIKLTHLGVAS